MTWWDHPELRSQVVAKCMDPDVAGQSAGVAAMALHGLGKAHLEALSGDGADLDAIVPHMAHLDLSDLAQAYAGAVGREQALDQLLGWHHDAAVGARQVARTLVAKSVPVPLAIQRAAAGYGCDTTGAGRFAARVDAATVHPLVLAHEGRQAASAWAAGVAGDTTELIAKERDEFTREGHEVVVERDELGRFTDQVGNRRVRRQGRARQQVQQPQQRADTGQQVQEELSDQERQRIVSEREDRQRRRKKREAFEAQVRRNRAAKAQAEERHARQWAQAVAEDRTMGRTLAARQQQTAVDRKATKQTARGDRKARVARQARQARHARQLRYKLAEQYQQRPPDDAPDIDWDAPPTPTSVLRRLLDATGGISSYTSISVSGTQYVQVPLAAVQYVAAMTKGGGRNGNSPNGPRIEIQALNEHLNTIGYPPAAVVDTGYALPLLSSALDVANGAGGYPVMNILCPVLLTNRHALGLDTGGDVAPFVSLDATAAVQAISQLVQYLGVDLSFEDSYSDQSWSRVIGDAESFMDDVENRKVATYDELIDEVFAGVKAHGDVDPDEDVEDHIEMLTEDVNEFLLGSPDETYWGQRFAKLASLADEFNLISSLHNTIEEGVAAQYVDLPFEQISAVDPHLLHELVADDTGKMGNWARDLAGDATDKPPWPLPPHDHLPGA